MRRTVIVMLVAATAAAFPSAAESDVTKLASELFSDLDAIQIDCPEDVTTNLNEFSPSCAKYDHGFTVFKYAVKAHQRKTTVLSELEPVGPWTRQEEGMYHRSFTGEHGMISIMFAESFAEGFDQLVVVVILSEEDLRK